MACNITARAAAWAQGQRRRKWTLSPRHNPLQCPHVSKCPCVMGRWRVPRVVCTRCPQCVRMHENMWQRMRVMIDTSSGLRESSAKGAGELGISANRCRAICWAVCKCAPGSIAYAARCSASRMRQYSALLPVMLCVTSHPRSFLQGEEEVGAKDKGGGSWGTAAAGRGGGGEGHAHRSPGLCKPREKFLRLAPAACACGRRA
jgi:hypothetical protein